MDENVPFTLVTDSFETRGASSTEEAPRRVWKQRLGRLATVVGAVVCLGALGWWVEQDPDSTPTPGASDAPALEVEELTSFVVRANGQKSWQLSAGRVVVSSDRSQVVAHNVHDGVLFRDGEPSVSLSAPRVVLNPNSRDLQAQGGVKASGRDKFAFSTPVVNWHEKTRHFECPQPTKATLHGLTFSAPTLRYDLDKGQISTPQPVQVHGTGIVLKAARLSADVKKRQLELGGGVELVFDPAKAKVPELVEAIGNRP